MAITKIASPATFAPAYNPLKFIYDGTNKNISGYRYIFDVYPAGSSTLLSRYKVFPQYSTGYGEIDISKLISSMVSFDVPFLNTVSYNIPNSRYAYDVKIGEEYITTYAYTASLVNNGGNVEITTTHTFVAGDQVTIAQADGGVANPNLEGFFTVLSVVGTASFTVNSLWANVTNATINGDAFYSDNRKTTTLAVATSTSNQVFNGALSFQDYTSYLPSAYLLSANTDYLLTNLPQTGFWATTEQDLFVNFGNNSVTTGFIYFENSNGDIFKRSISIAQTISGVPCGPDNTGSLTLVSGTATLIKPTTTYYKFWYTNSGGTQHSVKYTVNIDTRCAIEDYSLLFMDRMGSFGSFAFQLRAYEKGTVSKQSFNKDVTGVVTAQIWGYLGSEYGQSVYSSTVAKTLELNTNWMTVEMAEYFEELISSPVVYLKVGRFYQAVTVIDSSFEVEKQRNKKLIKKTVTVAYANQNTVNI